MYASKTPMCRLVPYHDTGLKFDGASALQKQIVQFVAGIRGRRENPVTEKQVVAWFRSTDADFVKRQLSEVCASGRVKIFPRSLSSSRRHSGAYVYEVAE